MPDSRFERDTAVEHDGGDRFRARIDPGWIVMDGAAVNGGYLMAIGARAMRSAIEHPDPVTVTAHFLARPDPGPVTVRVEVVRTGRRHSTVQGRMIQDGAEVVRLLGAFGDLARAQGPTHVERVPPRLPPAEQCLDPVRVLAERGGVGSADAPIVHRYRHHVPEETLGWALGEPPGRGEISGWIGWPDTDTVDSLGLLAIADAYPPALFNLGPVVPATWAPTIELTVQVRRRPAPGLLATRLSTTAITSGYLEEDGEFWDAEGELVALSRQLALVGRADRDVGSQPFPTTPADAR